MQQRRDHGVTFIELLISIVLLGSITAGALTTLSVTISATTVDRDHANAHAWLQTAADVLYARELVPCDPMADPASEIATITAAYEGTIQQTENPEEWGSTNIRIFDLQFWHVDMDPVTKLTDEGWGDQCDSLDTNLQRIGIEVRSNDGVIVESVEVIIGE